MKQELENYKKYIRKFPTYNVLEYFSQESMDIYKNHAAGIKYEEVPLYNKRCGMKIGTQKFLITQWILIEVCFNSIKFSNDYRNNLIGKNEYYMLLNKTNKMAEKIESETYEKDNIFKHLICIANMEFDLEILDIENRFNRLYHMMTTINNNPKYDQTNKINYINFKDKFYKITGINYDKYINCYIFIVLISSLRKNTNIMDLVDDIKFDVSKLGFTKDEIREIISLQSKDYSFYREYDNWNILKYNPIVHSDRFKDKYIISNISALMISFSEFMYWKIRNSYCESKSNDFTNYFGHCFEFYLNDFFEEYGINHYKIPEIKDKTPDWKVETTNYIFLIEQKASLYPMDTRTITMPNRIASLEKYLKDNIKKAFIQLNNYKIESEKTIIRICLTLEHIYFPETIQEIVFKEITEVEFNDSLNWIVFIDDFEKLFEILSRDEEEFDRIINKKIDLEKNQSNNGRGFDMLLSSYKNDYICNKINYFEQILNKEKDLLDKGGD